MIVIQEMILQHHNIKVALRKSTHVLRYSSSPQCFSVVLPHNQRTNDLRIKHYKPVIAEGGLDNVSWTGMHDVCFFFS